MKEKHFKYLEDLIEDYLQLKDEQEELPLVIDKANKKYTALVRNFHEPVLKKSDTEEAYRLFLHVKKAEDRKVEITTELAVLQGHLKEFLGFLHGKQVTYEKKDDADKQKITYTFSLEGDEVKFSS